MTTEAAVVQMRAVYHQVSGSLIELKRQVREVENSLSVLLAKAPQPIDRSTLEDQVMPEELMAGVPLQLLENRPDVKVAEMTLASAYYTTNKARAAFYPGINITATAVGRMVRVLRFPIRDSLCFRRWLRWHSYL